MQSKALSITTAGHFFPLGIVEHTLPFFSFSAQKRRHFQASIILVILFHRSKGRSKQTFLPQLFAELKNKPSQGPGLYRERFIMPHTVLSWNQRWNEKSRPKLHGIVTFWKSSLFQNSCVVCIYIYIYNSHQWHDWLLNFLSRFAFLHATHPQNLPLCPAQAALYHRRSEQPRPRTGDGVRGSARAPRGGWRGSRPTASVPRTHRVRVSPLRPRAHHRSAEHTDAGAAAGWTRASPPGPFPLPHRLGPCSARSRHQGPVPSGPELRGSRAAAARGRRSPLVTLLASL